MTAMTQAISDLDTLIAPMFRAAWITLTVFGPERGRLDGGVRACVGRCGHQLQCDGGGMTRIDPFDAARIDDEWLEADAFGSFASGTVGTQRTRRYQAAAARGNAAATPDVWCS